MNQQSRDMAVHAPKQVPPPVNMARGIFVIQSTILIRGKGEEGDPARMVTQYFDKHGFLLAEDDPCETREKFHEMRKELREVKTAYKAAAEDRSNIWDENLRLKTRLDQMTRELNTMEALKQVAEQKLKSRRKK